MSSNYDNLNSSQPTPLPQIEQAQAKPRRGGVSIATLIISLVVVAALAGAGGWLLGNSGGYSKAQSDFRSDPQAFVQNAGGGGFGAGGPGGTSGTGGTQRGGAGSDTTGKITALNGNTLTVVTANSTVTVNLDNNTAITKVDTGATTDLKVGDRISVTGQTSGTTVTATRIVLGNITAVFGAGGGPGAVPVGTPGSGGNG